MTIHDFLQRAKKELQKVSDTPELDAEILLASVLCKPRTFLITRPDFLLSLGQKKEAGIKLQKRIRGLPIAYILGTKEFFGFDFHVNEHTLIPRPETEILVEKSISYLKERGSLIDVGTGSGCISISIAKNIKNIEIIAVDVSEKALEIAKKNAKKHNVDIYFFVSDFLKNIPQKEYQKPLIITANLPYVPENERHPSTKSEPESAIYSGKDGLNHYRIFFQQIQKLAFTACLFEFHPPQKQEIEAMLLHLFPKHHLEILPDLSGQARIGILSEKS